MKLFTAFAAAAIAFNALAAAPVQAAPFFHNDGTVTSCTQYSCRNRSLNEYKRENKKATGIRLRLLRQDIVRGNTGTHFCAALIASHSSLHATSAEKAELRSMSDTYCHDQFLRISGTRVQADEGVDFVDSAEVAAKKAPGCFDPSVGAATKELMGC